MLVGEDASLLSFKTNKVLLEEVEEKKIYSSARSKIDINNCLVLYYVANIFELSSLSEESLCLIERCFTAVAQSSNFLLLDLVLVSKILSSSGLNIDSELQVFNPGYSWLRYDINERRKHAKIILSKVRLPLLSAPALKEVLEKILTLGINDEYFSSIEESLKNRSHLIETNHNTERRYCSQDDFKVVVCGGYDECYVTKEVKQIRSNNLSEASNLPRMKEGRSCFGSVCVEGEVYVFGGTAYEKALTSVEKYSPATNTWEHICDLHDDRTSFSTCSFMNSVYVIGGFIKKSHTASCVKLCATKLRWKVVSEMAELRRNASACVFEGSIVASGGYNNYNGRLETVEKYDHAADTWTNMPGMVQTRCYHKSVAVRNKLFVVGGHEDSYEVYDSFTNKFAYVNVPLQNFEDDLFEEPNGVIATKSKILVFYDFGCVFVYDLNKDEWTEESCEATKNLRYFSCAKLPITKVEM